MQKHLLPFILLLLLSSQTKAQTSVYHPFPDSNAYWTEQSAESPNGIDYKITTYSIFINGDTVIGGKIYHKLYSSGYQYPNNLSQIIYFSNTYKGALRQDTAQRKVFIALPNRSSDTLLYDFNIVLGNPLPKCLASPPFNNVVYQIDSVLMGNNYRKRFWINCGDIGYFIEGMGSEFGLMGGNFSQFEREQILNCFRQDGQTLFLRTGQVSCQIETGTHELMSEMDISLYPNPATSTLTIHTLSDSWQKAAVSIMNVLGQETSPPAPLLQERGDAVIEVSGLAAGIYFVQVVGEKERWISKFVKL